TGLGGGAGARLGAQTRAREEVIMAASERRSSAISASRQYAPYVEADWGFKNTWYPALFSHELGENSVKGVTMAGHDIALRRSRGEVYALRDRCAHRGVKMSLRPMCLT